MPAVGDIPEAEEVLALRRWLQLRLRSLCLRKHGVQDLDRLVDLRLADDQAAARSARRWRRPPTAAARAARARATRSHRIAVDDQPLQQARARARRASWAAAARPGAATPSPDARPSRGSARAARARRSRCCTYSAAAVANGLPPKVEACVPGSKPRATSSLASIAPMGTPPARPLASVTTSGTTRFALERVEGAGAPGAGLDLVEDQDGARVGAGAPQLLQVARRRQVDAALAPGSARRSRRRSAR